MAKDCGIAMTLQEMLDAGVGKYVPTRTPEYTAKKTAYTKEKVWFHFMDLRREYCVKFTRQTDGWVNNDKANEVAQMEMDNLLIRRARGEAVALPNDNPAPTGPDPDEYLMDAEAFGETKDGTTWKDIVHYVFNNMDVKNPDPKLAPCPGAFAYLRRIQASTEVRDDFCKTVWPKTFTKEAEKGADYNDDGRSTIDLIKRLQGKGKDNPAIR